MSRVAALLLVLADAIAIGSAVPSASLLAEAPGRAGYALGAALQSEICLGCRKKGIELFASSGSEEEPPFVNLAADLEFSSTQWLSAADTAILDPAGGVFMLQLWVTRESSAPVAYTAIQKRQASAVSNGYSVSIANDGRFDFFVHDGTQTLITDFSSVTSTNTWYYLCVGVNATVAFAQMNNETPKTGTKRLPVDDTEDWTVGGQEGGAFTWDGKIARVGFWKGTGADETLCDAGHNGGIAPNSTNIAATVGVAPTVYCDLNDESGSRVCEIGGITLGENNGPIASAAGPPES